MERVSNCNQVYRINRQLLASIDILIIFEVYNPCRGCQKLRHVRGDVIHPDMPLTWCLQIGNFTVSSSSWDQ